jgi:hypothetical protein
LAFIYGPTNGANNTGGHCGKLPRLVSVTVPKDEKPAASSSSSSTTNATAAAKNTAASTSTSHTTATSSTSTITAATDATHNPNPATDTTATPMALDVPDGKTPLSPEEAITTLISLGFPEAEMRHCMRVSHGDPNIAVELLRMAIPDNTAAAADLVRASNAASPAAAYFANSAATTTARSCNASSSAATGSLQISAPSPSVQMRCGV